MAAVWCSGAPRNRLNLLLTIIEPVLIIPVLIAGNSPLPDKPFVYSVAGTVNFSTPLALEMIKSYRTHTNTILENGNSSWFLPGPGQIYKYSVWYLPFVWVSFWYLPLKKEPYLTFYWRKSLLSLLIFSIISGFQFIILWKIRNIELLQISFDWVGIFLYRV